MANDAVTDGAQPVDEATPLTSRANSRRSYVALWALVVLLLGIGAALTSIQNVLVTSTVPDPDGQLPTTAIFVGGWGAAALGAGLVTLIVLLFLNAFTGGPLFIRERAEPEGLEGR